MSADERRGHGPKLAALLALEEGVLSEAGERRIRRHLDACEHCRGTLGAIRSYAALSHEVAQGQSEVDWSRVRMPVGAAELGSEPQPPSPSEAARDSVPERAVLRARLSRRRFGFTAGALAAAAAIGAGFFAWPGPGQPAPKRAPVATAHPAPVATPLVGWATAFSDGAELRNPAERGFRQVSLASTVKVGGVLRLTEGAVLDLALESGATLRLHSAEVRFERLDSREIKLELRRGEVSQRVPPLRPGATYAVVAGDHEVRVHGTHFVVRRGAVGASVQLFEGEVAVHDRAGETVGSLHGAGEWHATPPEQRNPGGEPGAGPDSQPREQAGLALYSPLPFVSREGGATVAIPPFKRVARWRRGDSLLPGDLAFRILLPLGQQTLVALLSTGEEVPVELDIGPQGLVLTHARLSRLLPRSGPVRGQLAPERLRSVLQAGQPRLQHCYERALRRFPDLQPSLSLRIDLGGTGGVRAVRVVKGEAPELLQKCVERVAGSFRFPAPGGPMTFDAPLRFRRKL